MSSNIHYFNTKKYYQQKALLSDGYYDSEPGQIRRHSIWTHMTRQNIMNLLSEIIRKDPEITSIVDLGCGRGDFTKKIGEKFPFIKRIEGIDNVDEALNIAERETKHLNNVSFNKGDLLNLPYNGNSFDVAVCVNVLHHVYKHDQNKVITEIARVAKNHILLEIKNINNFYYKYINPKSFGGFKVYPTTLTKIKLSLDPHNFKLKRKLGIFYWEWLSPLVQAFFTNKSWIYIIFGLYNLGDYLF